MKMKPMTKNAAVLAAGLLITLLLAGIMMAADMEPAEAGSYKMRDGYAVSGDQRIYVDTVGNKHYLVRENTATSKVTRLKKLYSPKQRVYYHIAGAYKNNIVISGDSFELWKLWSYTYNVNSKKLVKTNDCGVISDTQSGKYVAASRDYQSDTSAHPKMLYKITNKGLKKVKRLARYGLNVDMINGKYYYTSYTSKKMNRAKLLRCNRNGKGVKTLCSAKASKKYVQVMFQNVHANYCELYNGKLKTIRY